jgi:hypothetical protein
MPVPYPSLDPSGWHPPQDLVDLAAEYPAVYDEVGSACSGGVKTGTQTVGEYVKSQYPGINETSYYNCRGNTADTGVISMHGAGRAVDLMIPKIGNQPNTAVGDPVAEWIARNAVGLGVQYFIWNKTAFSRTPSRSAAGRFSLYTGPVPHTDHIHTEVTLAAGAGEIPLFTGRWPAGWQPGGGQSGSGLAGLAGAVGGVQGYSTGTVVAIAAGGALLVGMLGYLAYALTEDEAPAPGGYPAPQGYPAPGYALQGYPPPGYAPVYANPTRRGGRRPCRR